MSQSNIVDYFCGNGMLMTTRIPEWWMCTHWDCRSNAVVGCPYFYDDTDTVNNTCNCGRGACKKHLGEETNYA